MIGLDCVLQDIRDLAKLQEDWDDDGACTIKLEVRAKAEQFVNLINRLLPGCSMPYVDPTSDGGIDFHWRDEDREALAHISVDDNKDVDFYISIFPYIRITGRVDLDG